MMKCWKVVFLFFLIALTAGCTPRPLEDLTYPLLAPSGVSMADAAAVIRKGGKNDGWEMTQVAGNRFYATRDFNQHAIMVEVLFTTDDIVIKYRDSDNMDYDGTSIHGAYYREVGYLVGGIQWAAKFAVPSAEIKGSGSGTGFVVSPDNHILTNYHVAGDCKEVLVDLGPAEIVTGDEINDLALLKVRRESVLGKGPAAGSFAVFRAGPRLRKGEDVIIAGYPLSGLLSNEMKITTGSLNALAGLRNDHRTFQISAGVQPGNSGGPAFDRSGHVIGVVSSGIGEEFVYGWTGALPQNINFAIGLGMVRLFLETEGVDIATELSEKTLPSHEIAEQAQGFTVWIQCKN